MFLPRTSGNPKGMPPGTRHRATRLAEKLMSGDIEGVVQSVITAALGGDMQACKIVLDRIALPAAAGGFGWLCRRSSAPPIW